LGFWVPGTGTFYLGESSTDLSSLYRTEVTGVPSPSLPLIGRWGSAEADSIGLLKSHDAFLKYSIDPGQYDHQVNFPDFTGVYPVVGNWTGTSAESIGSFDPNSGEFNLPGHGGTIRIDGTPLDAQPVAGQWESGPSIGVYSAAEGKFLLKNIPTNGAADIIFPLTCPSTCIPLSGDWDGDGHATVALI
jgi:hypothetical protein